MGAGAALKARQIAALARQVLAVELLVAAQALDLRAPLTGGLGTRAAHRAVRQRIPHLDRDRLLHADLAAALALVEEGAVEQAVRAAVGALA
jgi:histidine ammonia-lyase